MHLPKIGITQGRLSNPLGGKIQSFPKKTWQKEFKIAKSIGFDLIEWIVDENLDNPIFNKDFHRELDHLKNENKIQVISMACDFFMYNSFSNKSENFNKLSLEILEELVNKVLPSNNISNLILPLIGKTSLLEDDKVENDYVEIFNNLIGKLERHKLRICLETDLNPLKLNNFLKKINNERIKITYDTGNSAFWSHDYKQILDLLRNNISHVHIKDCTPKNYSVKLGTGDVNFDYIFKNLKKMNYTGNFILQAAREIDEIKNCTNQFKFTQNYINKYFKWN